MMVTIVLGGTGCTEAQVDGVTVCTEVGETITLQCKYSLDDVELDDNFQITGQDTFCFELCKPNEVFLSCTIGGRMVYE